MTNFGAQVTIKVGKCINNKLSKIFNTSWLSRIHRVFDDSPDKEVHWRYVWRSWRKFNGPSPADPFIRKCLIQQISDNCSIMGWGSILLEVQVIEIWSLFQCRYDDISQFVQVPFSCNSSVEELVYSNFTDTLYVIQHQKKYAANRIKILLEKQVHIKKIFTNLITTTVNKYCSKYNFFIN